MLRLDFAWCVPYPTESLPIAWTDGNVEGIPHGGFLSGARRKWGATSANAVRLTTLGFEHGVSDDTTPLP